MMASSLGAVLHHFPLLAPRPTARRTPTSRRAVPNKISCIGCAQNSNSRRKLFLAERKYLDRH
ncbi:hypothetical protein BRADI_1g59883v3 [Brachypodium distachyon]|uniref:Uncharacterized protein n=1 Tax=Brachypodium distachyon TaxID=15368 RepID=A0A2K2DSJ5_BRADI|nr:hypothetical protein BRADI_1g59883v3 [Brachypodium distachyon]